MFAHAKYLYIQTKYITRIHTYIHTYRCVLCRMRRLDVHSKQPMGRHTHTHTHTHTQALLPTTNQPNLKEFFPVHRAGGKQGRNRPQQLPQQLSALLRLGLDAVSSFVARALGGDPAGVVGKLVNNPDENNGVGSREKSRTKTEPKQNQTEPTTQEVNQTRQAETADTK